MLFDEDQRRARGPAGAVPRALETRNQRRLAFDAVVVRAVHTQLDGTRFAADPARLQVLQSLHQLLLELLLAADVLARLVELGREERAPLKPATSAGSRSTPWACVQSTHSSTVPVSPQIRHVSRYSSPSTSSFSSCCWRRMFSRVSSSLAVKSARNSAMASGPRSDCHQRSSASRVSWSEMPSPCSRSIQRTRSIASG